MTNRNLFSTGSLIILALLFVGLVILSDTLVKGVRVDLTENHQYTLSQGTRNILAGLEEPVNIYYFFSEKSSGDLPQVRTYARWVGEMLDEMAERSGGKLTVHRVDPTPFSTEEDQAAQFGLQGVPVGASGDTLYFGLAGTNSLDDVQTVPFLQPSKQEFLEYDLAKMISTLSHPHHPKVGILSSLDMAAGFNPATQQPHAAWVIYDQLDQLYDLETIKPDAESLPSDLDLLFLVHPKELSDKLRYAVDQFVLHGGRLVAFMDPFAEADRGGDPSDPMSRLNVGSSSTLGPLLKAWGVTFDPTKVVGDELFALQVNVGNGQPPQRHLGILSVTREGLDQDDIVSADLESVNFSSAGWLNPVEGATTQFVPLVQTSKNAAPIDASRLRFLANPEDLMNGFQPTGDRYALVARVSGPAKSAFDKPPDGVDASKFVAAAGDDGINVILFADTDVLTDRLWVRRQQFFGQSLVNSFADNGTLVVNAVDNLLGSKDLISIRTRASSARPFERVDHLRLTAEGKYRATEERLKKELADTENKLKEMQSSRTEGDMTVLNADQQAELQKFTDKRLQIRSELRQVRHDLDKEIDALGTRLKVWNIGVAPLLVIFVALLLAHRRRVRRDEEVT